MLVPRKRGEGGTVPGPARSKVEAHGSLVAVEGDFCDHTPRRSHPALNRLMRPPVRGCDEQTSWLSVTPRPGRAGSAKQPSPSSTLGAWLTSSCTHGSAKS